MKNEILTPRKRVYHFHPKSSCKGGVTVVYDPASNCFAIARCSTLDNFNRRRGLKIAETRLHSAPVAMTGTFPNSYQSHIFSGRNFGINNSSTPTPQDISCLAYLFAVHVADSSIDLDLSSHLKENRPQIPQEISTMFGAGIRNVGWVGPRI